MIPRPRVRIAGRFLCRAGISGLPTVSSVHPHVLPTFPRCACHFPTVAYGGMAKRAQGTGGSGPGPRPIRPRAGVMPTDAGLSGPLSAQAPTPRKRGLAGLAGAGSLGVICARPAKQTLYTDCSGAYSRHLIISLSSWLVPARLSLSLCTVGPDCETELTGRCPIPDCEHFGAWWSVG